MKERSHGRTIAGLVLIALGAFLLTSLVTHDPLEGPFPDFAAQGLKGNACGAAGAYVSAYGLALLGWAAYLVAAMITSLGLLLTLRVGVTGISLRAGGSVLVVASLVVGLSMLDARAGILGIVLAGALYGAVGPTGTLILVAFALCVGALLAAGGELAALFEFLARAARQLAARVSKRLKQRRAQAASRAEWPSAPAVWEPEAARAAKPAPATDTADIESALAEERPAALEEQVAVAEPDRAEPEIVTGYSRLADQLYGGDDEEELDVHELTGREGEGEYILPPITLLEDLPQGADGDDEADIREKGRLLEQTLAEFRIEARVVRVQRGPVITMYELSLAPGTKVSRVESLSDDLAIALRAPNVRIVAPLPGRNTVGIEVPNTERELVGMRGLIEEAGDKAAKMAIPLFLGKDTSGNPLVLDLARCPHLLVAGATGSGKTVAINAMITSILMTRTPEEVQLLLVDPKSVEFSDYSQLPHLICPVLSDMKKAASVLKWACKKMDERYSILASVGVRDLKSYNQLGREEIVRRLDPDGDAILDDVPFHMPHIVIIVDEFGELMMVAAKEVEGSVIRLSQKARAVGIHLICATQRPSVDVITGLIKANLPARIAFQVASKVDSRTILDRNGADLLLGRGDMLLLPPGTSRLVRAQGSYVSDEDVEKMVDFLDAQGGPQFRADIRDYHAQQGGVESSDDLYDEAVRVVVETQRGSVSLLQRRLSIGYSRAARLIDMMAEAGVVGAYRGSQARRVLMTLEEWERAHVQA